MRPLGFADIFAVGLVAFGLGADYVATADKGLQYQNKKLERLESQASRLAAVYLPEVSESPSLFFDHSMLAPRFTSCQSGSMEPAISCRDFLLHSYRPKPSEIKVGDIVAYRPDPKCWVDDERSPTHPILHRVTGIIQVSGGGKEDSFYYRMQGDANSYTDPCNVPYERILSRLVGVIRGARDANFTNMVNLPEKK